MLNVLKFPTALHENAANEVRNYFRNQFETDTILIVNSCARAQAVPESDLDFAILVKPDTVESEILKLEKDWNQFCNSNQKIKSYKKLSQYSHLHLDIIKGDYRASTIEVGEPWDYYEIVIGNQICYSLPFGFAGEHFTNLRSRYLPYYEETLRKQRLVATIKACHYDLDHIAVLVERGLFFHALDILTKAFQEYLQALFITNKKYPIAYNKWIKYQLETILGMPELYPILLKVFEISNMESDEIIFKAEIIRNLLSKCN